MPILTDAPGSEGPAAVQGADIDKLRTSIGGTVVTRSDQGWDAARAAWNLSGLPGWRQARSGGT